MFDDDDSSEHPRHHRMTGALVLGPEWKNFGITLVLGAAPISLFFVTVAPDVQRELGWGPVIAVIVLSVVMYVSLLMTGLKDPGIIPREPASPIEAHIPRQKEYDINGFCVTTKRCITCHVYRPPRCSHCAVCNNCVEKFDHHCPWVGTCIGRRNYQPYLAFVYSAFLDCALVIALSIWRLVDQTGKEPEGGGNPFHGALQAEPSAAILIIYCFLVMLFVGALSGLHTYLLSTNQTTYEYFRHRYGRAENPFRRPLLKNVYEACCGATGLYKYHGENHPAQTTPLTIPPPPLLPQSDGVAATAAAQNGTHIDAGGRADAYAMRPDYGWQDTAGNNGGGGGSAWPHASGAYQEGGGAGGAYRSADGGGPLGDAPASTQEFEVDLEVPVSPAHVTIQHHDNGQHQPAGALADPAGHGREGTRVPTIDELQARESYR